MQTKTDLLVASSGVLGATWLGLGDLNAMLAVGVATLTICLLLLRIALAIREWRR